MSSRGTVGGRAKRLERLALLFFASVSSAHAQQPLVQPSAEASPVAALPAAASAGASPPIVHRALVPEEVTGVVQPAREPSGLAKKAAHVALYVPRSMIELLFLTTGTGAGLVTNEQLVPRARQFFFTDSGELGVYPTVFAETGSSPNVGARLIASSDPLATTLRVGYGGPDENVVESRLRWALGLPLPSIVWLEGLHDRKGSVGYLGLGQTPERDVRNHFSSSLRSGSYLQKRERVIAGFGARPGADFELLLSSSYTQRWIEDARGSSDDALSRVFDPESIVGFERVSRAVYSEAAVRWDTRNNRTALSPGGLAELYAGEGDGVLRDHYRFFRGGARVGAYIPLVRSTTILSPRLVVDTLGTLSNDRIPFFEYAGQPAYRGKSDRRDNLSVVGSLDYRWQIARFIATRLFVDGAWVSPDVKHLRLSEGRWATGLALDVFSADTELVTIGSSVSADGIRLLLSVGIAPHFGDRQHRD